MVVLTQFGYLSSFYLSAYIVKHSVVPLPALDSKRIKNLIWLSRTLPNVMGEYFVNQIVQSCGKGYGHFFLQCVYNISGVVTERLECLNRWNLRTVLTLKGSILAKVFCVLDV